MKNAAKKKGYIVIQTVLALILLSACAVGFFQIYSGQFSALASAHAGNQAQKALDLVLNYLKMQDYSSLPSTKTGSLSNLFNSNLIDDNLSKLVYHWDLGEEKNIVSGSTSTKYRLVNISIKKNNEPGILISNSYLLNIFGNRLDFVKNNNYNSGLMMNYISSGYLHGKFNGTEYPFYFNGYKKSDTYTKVQIDSLLNSLRNRLNTLENDSSSNDNGGTIIKAGVIPASSSGSVTIRFSSPFPNRCLGVCVTQSAYHSDGIEAKANMAVTSFNKSQFTAYSETNDNFSKPVYYIAFGN